MEMFFQIDEVASHFSVGRKTVCRWIAEGKLQSNRNRFGFPVISLDSIESLEKRIIPVSG